MSLQSDEFPECVMNYIAEVVRKIGYRRKVRREVKQELLDHFADGLAEYKDDLERKQQAEALIAKFGDAQVLAKLIRRSKKRRRPWWQKTLIRSGQTIVLIVILFSGYAMWFFSGQASDPQDYITVLNQTAIPQAQESDNAFPVYQQADDVYVPYDTLLNWALYDIKYIRESARRFTDLDTHHQTKLVQWLKEEQSIDNSITADLAGPWGECLDHNLVPYPGRVFEGTFEFYRYKSVVANIVQCVEEGLPLVLMDKLWISTNEYPLFTESPFNDWNSQTSDPNKLDAFRLLPERCVGPYDRRVDASQ